VKSGELGRLPQREKNSARAVSTKDIGGSLRNILEHYEKKGRKSRDKKGKSSRRRPFYSTDVDEG